MQDCNPYIAFMRKIVSFFFGGGGGGGGGSGANSCLGFWGFRVRDWEGLWAGVLQNPLSGCKRVVTILQRPTQDSSIGFSGFGVVEASMKL